MSLELIDQVVRSLLYEGYMLYPYRRSSLKNQHRWNFGIVYPVGAGPSEMTTECLVIGKCSPHVSADVRFLHIEEDGDGEVVSERTVSMDSPGLHRFRFGVIEGTIDFKYETIATDVNRIRVEISNGGQFDGPREQVLHHSLVSTHTILTIENGEFVSLIDPPEALREAATACTNQGTWPVLIGSDLERRYMLSSPIILYDYPQVAPESPGDLFDGLEIDEILTLRIMTMTDDEKAEMRRGGERERQLLERIEAMNPEQLVQLHGTIRNIRAIPAGFKPGDRVRLRPKSGGDVLDVVLEGKIAIVESVEQDFDNRTHVAVVIEDDPGKDLGLSRFPGHRFFFSADEMERVA